ncbi:hypothetical protein EUTSA_v10001867mg [Eutrema salsugineum]|uniref:3'-5' exonuclease domain-containing protein n=1 Tax=Eutrema salsugineum TaxID=72664 RepID=V4L5C6_EUTSA|nr:hypothetical protein EUTSA_v10001867mg [Eutrema salsugineum]
MYRPPLYKLGGARIQTTVVYKSNNDPIDDIVQTFLSNAGNKKKIIGLRTERAQNERRKYQTALLQLCDGDHCLIVQVPEDKNLPHSLFNFLNLPDFSFVGIGINKTLANLENEIGLTCSNAVEVGSSSWDLLNKTEKKCRIVRKFVSVTKPTSAISQDWKYLFFPNQIELATANCLLCIQNWEHAHGYKLIDSRRLFVFFSFFV